MKPQIARRLSGIIFLAANILFLVLNLHETNVLQLTAAILFMSCSISLILSANYHRFLFWGGIAVSVAYILTAISNDGDGNFFAYLSIINGIIAGVLIFRGGLQRETGKQYRLPYPIDILDKYPLASAGVIEGFCCLLLFISALLNYDYKLLIASGLWLIAHGFLIYSDEYLRHGFSKK